jgi:hypothetical protein
MPKITMAGFALSSLLFTTSGCAALNRTRPEDMTVPEHRDAARQDATGSEQASPAAQAGGRTAVQNRIRAESLRSQSTEHAAAADARIEQVNELCQESGAGAGLETLSVASVEPLVEADVPRELRNGKGYYPEHLKGARIVSLAPAGQSPGSLAAALRCEAARASSGIDETPESPLTVKSATATVRQRASSVVLEVRSKDSRAAEEILRRARRLASAKQYLSSEHQFALAEAASPILCWPPSSARSLPGRILFGPSRLTGHSVVDSVTRSARR